MCVYTRSSLPVMGCYTRLSASCSFHLARGVSHHVFHVSSVRRDSISVCEAAPVELSPSLDPVWGYSDSFTLLWIKTLLVLSEHETQSHPPCIPLDAKLPLVPSQETSCLVTRPRQLSGLKKNLKLKPSRETRREGTPKSEVLYKSYI